MGVCCCWCPPRGPAPHQWPCCSSSPTSLLAHSPAGGVGTPARAAASSARSTNVSALRACMHVWRVDDRWVGALSLLVSAVGCSVSMSRACLLFTGYNVLAHGHITSIIKHDSLLRPLQRQAAQGSALVGPGLIPNRRRRRRRRRRLLLRCIRCCVRAGPCRCCCPRVEEGGAEEAQGGGPGPALEMGTAWGWGVKRAGRGWRTM